MVKIAHKLLWFFRPLGFLIQVGLGVGAAFVVSLLIVSQGLSPKAPASISLRPAPVQPESSQKQEAKATEIPYAQPVRLKIPKLSVDAAMEHLGITPRGDMQSPSSPKSAGWYKFGANPGNKGSAAIAGHFGTGSYRGQSVFDNLHMLDKGDSVSVEDETGAIAMFTVQELQIYARDEIVLRVFNSSDGKAHLNLITCQGKWIPAEQTYENRLVVFADKIDN